LLCLGFINPGLSLHSNPGLGLANTFGVITSLRRVQKFIL
jgi:hypothetical protein